MRAHKTLMTPHSSENGRSDKQTASKLWVPLGHFYSPVPSLKEIKENESRIWSNIPDTIPGVELNVQEQLKFLPAFKRYYKEQPFRDEKQSHLRYFFNNPSYSYSDAICLFCMIRYLQPSRIVEIGSGYSSCVILDTHELFFKRGIACTFIDPNPELFYSLIKKSDLDRIEVLPHRVQDVDLDKFKELESGDILFIDSPHVAKTGGAVNHIFFNVLPALRSGVYIHFHDIFYPFDTRASGFWKGEHGMRSTYCEPFCNTITLSRSCFSTLFCNISTRIGSPPTFRYVVEILVAVSGCRKQDQESQVGETHVSDQVACLPFSQGAPGSS